MLITEPYSLYQIVYFQNTFMYMISSCEVDTQLLLAEKDTEAGNNAVQKSLFSVIFPVQGGSESRVF